MDVIRQAEPSDAEAVAAIYAPYVTSSVISFEYEPPGAAEMAERMARNVGPWLVFVRDGQVLGYAYGGRHRDRAAYQWAVDATVYVREDAHRKGIGRTLYRSLLGLLGLQGFYTVHAGITLPNEGSVGLHEAMGFRLVGIYPAVGWKLGAWYDVGWWRMPLRNPAASPLPPLPLSDLLSDPRWGTALTAGLAP